FRGRSMGDTVTPEAILCAAGAALCVRSLFGALWTEIPSVSPIAYTTLLVAAAVLLAKVWAHAPDAEPPRRLQARRHAGFALPHLLVAVLFLSYAAARLAWTYGVRSPERYYALETLAGRILRKAGSILQVYRLVASNTNRRMFPALVWRSTRIMGNAQKVLPVITRVLETYSPVFHTGGRRVLRRNDSAAAGPPDAR